MRILVAGIALGSLLLLGSKGQWGMGPGPGTPAASSPSCISAGFTHYRIVTVPTQSGLSGDLANYPLLISGTYSYLATVANGGEVQNANGYDVNFFTDTTCGTKLAWEAETYTAASGLVNYWVKVPAISHTGSITFVVAYDNSGISTDQSNPTGVWDSNFKGVYHEPNGTTLTNLDSTSNANNGTPTNASAATGQIDGASSFVGTGNVALGFGLDPSGNGRTYEAWVYPTSFANAYNSVMSMAETSSAAFTMLVKSNGKLALYLDNASGTSIHYDGSGSNTLSANTWYLIHMTYDSTAGLVGYVNGAVDGTAAANGTLPDGAGSCVGGGPCVTHIGDHPSIGGRNWNGRIDEARSSGIARSADWVKTDYASQSSPSTFYSVGIEH